jgi:hypothetical protein
MEKKAKEGLIEEFAASVTPTADVEALRERFLNLKMEYEANLARYNARVQYLEEEVLKVKVRLGVVTGQCPKYSKAVRRHK